MAYGHRTTAKKRGSGDPRYSTSRWRVLALRVRRRDGRCMIVDGCQRGAQVADHIVRVTPDMPDWQFYDETNLRGACQVHNKARGMETVVQRELHGAPQDAPRASRYSVGGETRGRYASPVSVDPASSQTVVEGHETPGSLGTVGRERWRLVHLSPPSTVTGDYSTPPDRRERPRTADAH